MNRFWKYPWYDQFILINVFLHVSEAETIHALTSYIKVLFKILLKAS